MPRCEIIPEPHAHFRFQIEGREVTRWHYGATERLPFFYPLRGPEGGELTRMGHPGAPNHDHHRSVWFAHNNVMGVDFWSNETEAHVRQKHWLAIDEHEDWAGLAVELAWLDGHDPQPLLEQRLISVLHPDEAGQYQLELQSTFTASHGALELGVTNFGWFAIRVAKSMSAYFGQGEIRCSEGRQGEPEIFGQTARWMDYSGQVAIGEGATRRDSAAGLTLLDHASNESYPSAWHVREDGWMGPSFNRTQPRSLAQGESLTVRYLIDVHRGDYDPVRAQALAERFNARPAWQVTASDRPHVAAEIQPVTA